MLPLKLSLSVIIVTLLVCVASAKEHVIMIPKDWSYPQEHLGISLNDFTKGAIRLYNFSNLIMTVSDTWEYLEVVTQLKHTGRSKRDGSNLDNLHIHGNTKKLWIRDFIDEVEEYVNVTAEASTNSWALDRVDQRTKPLDGQYLGFETGITDKRVVHVYIVDTGVDSHPDISQTIINEFNAHGGDPTDCNGHGTHVTGIAMSNTYGISPSPIHIIHSVKVLDCNGLGDTADVLAGLSWIKANYILPGVINMSIGVKGITSSLAEMVKDLKTLGLVIVGAAGNQGDNSCLYFPAGIVGSSLSDMVTIGVGALAQTTTGDVSATYSNFGSCVRVWAPGSSVQSTLPGGLTGFKSGTSMAAPLLTGAIVLVLASATSITGHEAEAVVMDRVTKDLVTGTGVASSTNDVLYVPQASDEPIVPPSLATTTAAVASSTTTAASLASTTAVTTSTARTTTTRASTTIASTSTTRAATSASTTSRASTTNAATSTTRATTSASSTTRATTTAASTTRTTSTRASTSATSTSRASTTRASSTTVASTRGTTSLASTTRSATTRATTTGRASTTRASTTAASTSRASTSRASTTRGTTTRGTTTRAATTRSASTRATTTGRSSTSRASTTAASTTRASTSRTSTTRSASTRATTTGSTTTRAASTRATTTGRASTTRATTTGRASTTNAAAGGG